MAEIKATTNEKVFPIKAFLGLNQNPDGDTKLKMGEAAAMNNFRITRDRNLQRRPGTKIILDFETGKPVKGLWVGYVNGTEYMLGACDGKLYKLWDDASDEFGMTEIGAVSTDKDVHIFGFENKAYILDGSAYKEWDGETLDIVHGYRPLVKTNIPPDNVTDMSGLLENVNRLCKERRVWISPDGTGTVFHLPENDLESVDYVHFFGDPDDVNLTPTEDYTVDLAAGTVTFTQAPPQMVNAYEIGYTVNADSQRTDVEHMQYSELFAGTQDTRIFLYGDGTNKTIYSGIDYNGKPRADYFPDLYEALVGDENTPITGMIRHYSSLACYKKDSAWSISASSLTLAEGLNVPAFYVTPVNKAIGNAAPGQVRLVMNSPFTLFGNDCYEWKNSSYYTSNLTRDERQAKRISDRVWATLQSYKTEACYCYDDNDAQEYYICYDGDALIYNYAADAWSHYTDFPVSCMANIGEELYIGTPDGKVKRFSAEYMSDLMPDTSEQIIYPDGVTASFPLSDFYGDVGKTTAGFLVDTITVDDITITNLDTNTEVAHTIWGDFPADFHTGTWEMYHYDKATNSIVFTPPAGYPLPAANESGYNVTLNLVNIAKPIEAYWESGSMSFNQDYMRKYSAMAWVGVKPESNTELVITAKTDKKTCDQKTITTKAYQFDFNEFAFDTLQFDELYDPQMYREKIKAKKFVFYKLIFSNNNPDTRCTVLAADIRVRFTGFAK